MKTKYGIETVDQLERKDFATFREYRRELKSMVDNYHLCNMPVYKSQRPCNALFFHLRNKMNGNISKP
tara:strand:- start:413 stop:616 length:204 start_codon:yes stop_codon:yes gene_type:complete